MTPSLRSLSKAVAAAERLRGSPDRGSCRDAADWRRGSDDFVVATNAGFIEGVGGEWNGNLDTFNDYLSWPEEGDYELEVIGAEDWVSERPEDLVEAPRGTGVRGDRMI